MSPRPTRLPILVREAWLVAWAGLGGALCAWFDLPAAWMSGSTLMVALVSVIKPLPALRQPWFDATMLMSGVLIGSAATPEALAATAHYPGSLAMLVLALVAIIVANGAFLRYVARWSWIDALLAATPGALSAVIATAQAKGANIGRIAVIQLFRVLVLVALLPGVMQAMQADATGYVVAVEVATLADTGLLLASALTTALIFERMGVLAPFVLGPTLASAIIHGAGLARGTLPPEITVVVMVMLGAATGGRVASLQRRELLTLFPLALAGFAISMAMALAFAWPAAWLAGVPFVSAMTAFAPGGVEAMAMLAFAMGLDPLYVGAHHLARFIGISLVMPLLIARMKPEKPPR